MDAPKKEPEGIKCSCGLFSPFTGYVYAHMRDVLLFTCPAPGCGKQYTVLGGVAAPK